MGKKDPSEYYLKAQSLYKASQFKKAGKYFSQAAEEFERVGDMESAIDSYLHGAQSHAKKEIYIKSSELLRLAGHLSIIHDQFSKAHQIFQKALEVASKIDKIRERQAYQLLFSIFSFFCYFLEGADDKGIHGIKKVKKFLDESFFKNHFLTRVVKDFLLFFKNRNMNYVAKIEEELMSNDLLEGELKLIKTALNIAKINLFMKSELHLDKRLYTTNDLIKLTVTLDLSIIQELSGNSNQDFQIKTFKITRININLTDNFTTTEKPALPIILDLNRETLISYIIKPHFQVEEPKIGPITFYCILNDTFAFTHDTEVIKPNLISPPPTLHAETKNLRPPLTDKSFPLQITVENMSEGDAHDLNLTVLLPDQLKLIRGTLEKKVYSLNSYEKITWELQLKPIEAGDYQLELQLKYKDGDGNIIENLEQFPISVKM
ncbi:MAG: tetratricopeptide repeat protein [Promethearchaeota archaeon]